MENNNSRKTTGNSPIFKFKLKEMTNGELALEYNKKVNDSDPTLFNMVIEELGLRNISVEEFDTPEKLEKFVFYHQKPIRLFEIYMNPDTSDEIKSNVLRIMSERDIDLEKTKEEYIKQWQIRGINAIPLLLLFAFVGFIIAIVQRCRKQKLINDGLKTYYYDEPTRKNALTTIIIFAVVFGFLLFLYLGLRTEYA